MGSTNNAAGAPREWPARRLHLDEPRLEGCVRKIRANDRVEYHPSYRIARYLSRSHSVENRCNVLTDYACSVLTRPFKSAGMLLIRPCRFVIICVARGQLQFIPIHIHGKDVPVSESI